MMVHIRLFHSFALRPMISQSRKLPTVLVSKMKFLNPGTKQKISGRKRNPYRRKFVRSRRQRVNMATTLMNAKPSSICGKRYRPRFPKGRRSMHLPRSRRRESGREISPEAARIASLTSTMTPLVPIRTRVIRKTRNRTRTDSH